MIPTLPIKTRFLVVFMTVFMVKPVVAQTELNVIKTYLTKIAEHQEKATNEELNALSASDIKEMTVSSAYLSPSTGWFHAYFTQTYKGIDVFNALLNVTLKDGKVAHTTHQFVPNLLTFDLSEKPAVSPTQAIGFVAQSIGQNAGTPTALPIGEKPKVVSFQYESLSTEPIEVQLYWLPMLEEKRTTLRLVWNVRIQTRDNQHWWNIRVDAQNGEILAKNDWVVHCSFDNCRDEHPHTEGVSAVYNRNNIPMHFSADGHQNTEGVPTIAAPLRPMSPLMANTYNVFDLPLEAPSFGARSVVSNPYTRFAPATTGPGVTNGWHDNGTTAYTNTRGNNVYAQDDLDNNNATNGTSPSSATLEFTAPFTNKGVPADNLNAAITNLFYWNNLIHDVLYRYGFDEPSGNFQANNMGRGGSGNDFVYADAQDAAGTDNANFSTPADGGNGRMQMYLWNVINGTRTLAVNNPASIAATYPTLESTFSTGNKIVTLGPITGDVVLVSDATATTLGCTTPFANVGALTGKIALIDRGTCTFVIKAKNCQNAGAIAVIIANNVAGDPMGMGGTDNSITIPTFSISQADGVIIKNALAAGTVNVTMSGVNGTKTATDGDFDNGVISHEYGHGWSTRLTGGPANADCLNNAEQGGEGWSDYLGLMLTTNWAALTPSVASANISRTIGTYVGNQIPTGSGLRPFPYSYNMATVNPTVTYSQVANATNFSLPHGIGSIWATMLWDMTWEIILQDNTIIPDISNTTTLLGNVAALKLVNEGLRLQQCSPSFVQARDAILAADALLFAGKYRCSIWKAFARRGLGVNASTGVSGDDRIVTQDFSQPSGTSIQTTVSPISALEGTTVTYTLNTKCGCTAVSNGTISSVLPASMTYVSGSASNSGTLSGNTVSWTNQDFAPSATQIYTFQAAVKAGTFAATTKPLDDNMDGSTPSGAWVSSATTGTTQWVVSSAQANSPTKSVYAASISTATDFSYKSGLSFNLVGPATLSFTHRFFTEADYDGGVVEISTNGGASWADLGDQMTTNGYTGDLGGFGRKGFTGDGQTWRTTTISLEPFCGTTAQIRFRMLTDGGADCGTEGACGWYVDDVVLTIPSGANTVGNSVTTSGNSSENACLQILQNAVLPIELLSFSATPRINTIQLDWLLETEQQLSGFDIMKSSDGKTFEKIAWLAKQAYKRYFFSDDSVQTNTLYYYFLRAVDMDGKVQDSKIVSAQIEDKNKLTVFPNPSKGVFTITGENIDVNKLTVFNALWQKVNATITQERIDISDLPNGMYFLNYLSLPKGVQTLKLMKN
jgi:extracellular elastinolytic metalloproteinase